MKPFLVLSAALCLLSILRTSPKSYFLTVAYLVAVIPATLAFRAESAWLHSWYAPLAVPVGLLRLAASVEIAHRQTEGFRWWSRLMGSVFLLAGMFCALAWVQSGRPGMLVTVVECRRLLQIFAGSLFLVLECFWLSQGGGYWRRADQIALAFALLAWNHAAVSFMAAVWPFDPGPWESLQKWSWGIDGVCYLLLTAIFLSDPLFCADIGGSLRRRLASHGLL